MEKTVFKIYLGGNTLKTDKNILVAFLLNLCFSLVEFIGGLFTRSVAILSDSIHDLGDSFSIGLSYILEKKSKKKANYKYTYGYVRYSVLGSIITTLILLLGSVFVIFESIKRIFNPIDINYNGMLIIAIFGLVINFLAAYFTKDGKSLNQKSVNLHMLEDVLGWLVVLIGAIIMKFTSIVLIDPLLSLIVALFILISAFKNLKEIVDLFLEKTPDDINIEELQKEILKIKGVDDVHHIHVRSMDGFNNFATLHIVTDKYSKELKDLVKKKLSEYHIGHSTVEIELKDEKCLNKDCQIEQHFEHHH